MIILSFHLIFLVFVNSFVYRLRHHAANFFILKDASIASAFFKVGDRVQVCADVFHRDSIGAIFNSRNLIGRISEVWEKCDVDPHCCCAELAFDAPIKVAFESKEIEHKFGEKVWSTFYSVTEIQKVA